jgi:hypothetical protein
VAIHVDSPGIRISTDVQQKH